MVSHHSLRLFIIGEFRAAPANFVDEEINSGTVFDNVFIETRIAGDSTARP
jgi:hypothetical protein